MSNKFIIPWVSTIVAPTASYANGLMSSTTTVNTSAATAPTTGQVLQASSSTAAAWQNLKKAAYIATAAVDVSTSGEQTLVGSGNGSLSYTPVANQVLRFTASGYHNAVAAGAPTVQMKIKKGSTTLGTFVASTAFAVAATGAAWQMNVDVIIRSTTTTICNGNFYVVQNASTLLVRAIQQTAVTTISASAETLDFTWNYGTTVAGNDIHCTCFMLEILS